jgi:hypothetical protein
MRQEVYMEIGTDVQYFIGIADHSITVLYNEAKIGVVTSKC